MIGLPLGGWLLLVSFLLLPTKIGSIGAIIQGIVSFIIALSSVVSILFLHVVDSIYYKIAAIIKGGFPLGVGFFDLFILILFMALPMLAIFVAIKKVTQFFQKDMIE